MSVLGEIVWSESGCNIISLYHLIPKISAYCLGSLVANPFFSHSPEKLHFKNTHKLSITKLPVKAHRLLAASLNV